MPRTPILQQRYNMQASKEIGIPMTYKTDIDTLPAVQDAIDFTVAVCNFNAEPFRLHAEQYVEKYSKLEFTEEDVKDVKKIIAELNNKAREFDDIRKDIKKKFSEPLKAFEVVINSVSSVYENSVEILKSKLEVYERKYRDEKTTQIENINEQLAYEHNMALSANFPIIKESYYNKTMSLAAIRKDLEVEFKNLAILQENERLKEIAEAERLQRRMTMLNELNAKYKDNLPHELTYVETAKMDDDQVREYVKGILEEVQKNDYPLINPHLAEIKGKYEGGRAWAYPFPVTCNLLIDPSDLKTVENLVNIVDDTLENRKAKFTYICEITSKNPEDDILPFLQKMKEVGIKTIVHKREIL